MVGPSTSCVESSASLCCVCVLHSFLGEICALGCACFNESAEIRWPESEGLLFTVECCRQQHNRHNRPIQDYEAKSRVGQVKSDRHLLSSRSHHSSNGQQLPYLALCTQCLILLPSFVVVVAIDLRGNIRPVCAKRHTLARPLAHSSVDGTSICHRFQ